MSKKFFFFSVILLFLNCNQSDERCGIIIQKIERDNIFYFVLQTDVYINYYNNPNRPNLPDNGVRQGMVSQETYKNFQLGDEYCSEI
jgi:hypothetical protein